MLNGEAAASLFGAYEFSAGDTVVAAVSGGSDSTALLLLLKSYLDSSGPGARLIAATVDHGLRTESAAEALAVSALCRDHGIAHETLKWEGEKPSSGISAAARLARHRLLAGLAERERAAAVFTGHTRDDQAETVLMRNARGDGAGIAGMAPATLFDGQVWFMRPLLGVRRKDLRDWLAGRGIGWFDDPSNTDARYERARIRSALRQDADGAARAEQAISMARDAAALRIARANWAAALLRNHAVLVAPGLIRLERAALGASDETVIHALRALVAVCGGAAHLPDMPRAAALLEKIRAGNARATLSRTLIDARKDAVYFLRERRGLPGSPALPTQQTDRRFRMVPQDGDRPQTAGFSGEAPASLLRAAAASQPSVPQGWRVLPRLGPWTQFLPMFDLALAAEIARIAGAQKVPIPPFQRHNAASV